jgi:hypothetical protein
MTDGFARSYCGLKSNRVTKIPHGAESQLAARAVLSQPPVL